MGLSADSAELFGAKNNSPSAVDTSTNLGFTWINRTNFSDVFWSSAAASANGQILALADDVATIYISTNSGIFWKNIIHLPAPSSYGAFVTLSASGNTLSVAVCYKGFYSTTNLGVTWMTNNVSGYWRSMASSSDGSRLFAVAGTSSLNPPGVRNAIFSSTNTGVTWISNDAPSLNWSSIACSADGLKLVASAFGGGLYSSTNGGINWVSNIAPVTNWTAVASSADGNKFFAAAENAQYSATSGGIWTSQATPSPTLRLTPTNNSLSFSWLISSTNFVLQQTSDLANWADVTNEPVLNLTNLQNQVMLPASSSNLFFRLKTP
jgi:hypothetical protein